MTKHKVLIAVIITFVLLLVLGLLSNLLYKRMFGHHFTVDDTSKFKDLIKECMDNDASIEKIRIETPPAHEGCIDMIVTMRYPTDHEELDATAQKIQSAISDYNYLRRIKSCIQRGKEYIPETLNFWIVIKINYYTDIDTNNRVNVLYISNHIGPDSPMIIKDDDTGYADLTWRKFN